MRFLVCTTDANPCPPEAIGYLNFSDAMDFAAMGITSADVLFVFGWGFSLVMFGWLAGYGVQLAKTLISKL